MSQKNRKKYEAPLTADPMVGCCVICQGSVIGTAWVCSNCARDPKLSLMEDGKLLPYHRFPDWLKFLVQEADTNRKRHKIGKSVQEFPFSDFEVITEYGEAVYPVIESGTLIT